MDLTCKCGHEMFNIATNGKYARCSKCGKVYDEKGEEVEVHRPLGGYGETIFLKHNKVLPLKIQEYKPGQNLFNDGTEEY
jgi:hypothetical protein